jgi:hypothetical protein
MSSSFLNVYYPATNNGNKKKVHIETVTISRMNAFSIPFLSFTLLNLLWQIFKKKASMLYIVISAMNYLLTHINSESLY